MENVIKLKAFIGYQIQSAYHASEKFRSMAKNLNDHLSKSSPTLSLDIEFGEFPPGVLLWQEIKQKIELSDITVFDISENDPNVLLEAGIAIGNDKHVIFIKSEESIEKYHIPTDLRSFVYLTYKDKTAITAKQFIKSIADSIFYYLDHKCSPYLYYHLIWSFEPESKTIIVPSFLPDEMAGNIFEDYIYMRRYGDLDATFIVAESLHRLYPKMDISIDRARNISELPRNWEQYNFVFIGGPDFNPIINEFSDLCPIEYVSNDSIYLRHKKTNYEYRTKFYKRSGKSFAVDHGFFLSILKKLHNTRLIFLGGARTWGVYGASKLVSCTNWDKNSYSYKNAQQIVNRFGSSPSLFIPIKVKGTHDGIHSPEWNMDDIEQIN